MRLLHSNWGFEQLKSGLVVRKIPSNYLLTKFELVVHKISSNLPLMKFEQVACKVARNFPLMHSTLLQAVHQAIQWSVDCTQVWGSRTSTVKWVMVISLEYWHSLNHFVWPWRLGTIDNGYQRYSYIHIMHKILITPEAAVTSIPMELNGLPATHGYDWSCWCYS